MPDARSSRAQCRRRSRGATPRPTGQEASPGALRPKGCRHRCSQTHRHPIRLGHPAPNNRGSEQCPKQVACLTSDSGQPRHRPSTGPLPVPQIPRGRTRHRCQPIRDAPCTPPVFGRTGECRTPLHRPSLQGACAVEHHRHAPVERIRASGPQSR